MHVTTVRKGLVHLNNGSEGFDASGHHMSCSVLVVLPLGVGRQALHPQAHRPSLQQQCEYRRRRRDCTSGPPPHIVGLHFDTASSCTTTCMFRSSPLRITALNGFHAVSGSPIRNPFGRVSLVRERLHATARVTGSLQNFCQYVNLVNVVWVKPICEILVFHGDRWHRHRGRCRRGGRRMLPDVLSEANVTDLRKPQPERCSRYRFLSLR